MFDNHMNLNNSYHIDFEQFKMWLEKSYQIVLGKWFKGVFES